MIMVMKETTICPGGQVIITVGVSSQIRTEEAEIEENIEEVEKGLITEKEKGSITEITLDLETVTMIGAEEEM